VLNALVRSLFTLAPRNTSSADIATRDT